MLSPLGYRKLLAATATLSVLAAACGRAQPTAPTTTPAPPAPTTADADPAAAAAPAVANESPAPPRSVAAVLTRFQQHMPLADLVPHLGTFERRVTSRRGRPPADYFFSVYRLGDGVAIVVAHSQHHMDDLWWVAAGMEPLMADESGPGAAAHHLAHSW